MFKTPVEGRSMKYTRNLQFTLKKKLEKRKEQVGICCVRNGRRKIMLGKREKARHKQGCQYAWREVAGFETEVKA